MGNLRLTFPARGSFLFLTKHLSLYHFLFPCLTLVSDWRSSPLFVFSSFFCSPPVAHLHHWHPFVTSPSTKLQRTTTIPHFPPAIYLIRFNVGNRVGRRRGWVLRSIRLWLMIVCMSFWSCRSLFGQYKHTMVSPWQGLNNVLHPFPPYSLYFSP